MALAKSEKGLWLLLLERIPVFYFLESRFEISFIC